MSIHRSTQTKWAYEVLNAHYDGRVPKPEGEEELSAKAGCFVSLHNPDGSLRGCIGTILPTKQSLLDEDRKSVV